MIISGRGWTAAGASRRLLLLLRATHLHHAPLLPQRFSERRATTGTKVSASLRISGSAGHIVKCFSRLEKFLPLARIRKFARKTRAYRRAYREEAPNSLADVERLVKVYKSHRSADVFDKKFCHADE